MPVHPSIASGGGAIPITGGAATSGPANATGGTFGAVNIAGLFGSPSNASSPLVMIALVAAVGFAVFALMRKK